MPLPWDLETGFMIHMLFLSDWDFLNYSQNILNSIGNWYVRGKKLNLVLWEIYYLAYCLDSFSRFFLCLFRLRFRLSFRHSWIIKNKCLVIGSEMVEFLSWGESCILMNVIDWFFFCPENIPSLWILNPWIPSVFEGFLNTDTDLGFVLDVSSK